MKDLEKSKAFFSQLGFTFNAQFTDQNAACMIVSDTIYFMLLTEPFFKWFIKKEIADTTKSSEAIFALSVDSKELVDEMVGKAFAAGWTEWSEKKDHGFMYIRGFQDLDGHLREIFWMDPSAAQG